MSVSPLSPGNIQELFRVEKRGAFLKLVESVLRLSGGQTEATTLASLNGHDTLAAKIWPMDA